MNVHYDAYYVKALCMCTMITTMIRAMIMTMLYTMLAATMAIDNAYKMYYVTVNAYLELLES